MTLERVLLNVIDATLHLPLVSGHARFGRQKHATVVVGKGLHLRMQFGIEPVRMQHRRLEIVEHDPPGHAAEVPERVLQAH